MRSFDRHRQFHRISAAAVCLAVLACASTALACPTCKAALASNGGDLVSGFFYSILFMLSMPFLILGGISSYMYLLVRRARAERQAAEAVSTASAGHAESTRELHQPLGV